MCLCLCYCIPQSHRLKVKWLLKVVFFLLQSVRHKASKDEDKNKLKPPGRINSDRVSVDDQSIQDSQGWCTCCFLLLVCACMHVVLCVFLLPAVHSSGPLPRHPYCRISLYLMYALAYIRVLVSRCVGVFVYFQTTVLSTYLPPVHRCTTIHTQDVYQL